MFQLLSSSLRNIFSANNSKDLYLDLMQKCILNTIYEDPPLVPRKGLDGTPFDAAQRDGGLDCPSLAHSMIGVKRMTNLRTLTEYVIRHKIPGDFIETGAWRGGASIFMRAVLKAYGITDRTIWVADSFQGLPPPNVELYPADKGSFFHADKELAVSLENVQRNFAKYDLLDSQVKFLKGWFKDTLPTAPIDRLAILRLDGDMYESTIQALDALFHKLSPGGFVIVDDYGDCIGCRTAISDFRNAHGIRDGIFEIDGIGVFWQKSKNA